MTSSTPISPDSFLSDVRSLFAESAKIREAASVHGLAFDNPNGLGFTHADVCLRAYDLKDAYVFGPLPPENVFLGFTTGEGGWLLAGEGPFSMDTLFPLDQIPEKRIFSTDRVKIREMVSCVLAVFVSLRKRVELGVCGYRLPSLPLEGLETKAVRSLLFPPLVPNSKQG